MANTKIRVKANILQSIPTLVIFINFVLKTACEQLIRQANYAWVKVQNCQNLNFWNSNLKTCSMSTKYSQFQV